MITTIPLLATGQWKLNNYYMDILDLKCGATCFYKNHLYVVDNVCKLKYVKDDADMFAGWENCVIYRRIDHPSDKEAQGPFVRRIDDFIGKFELVKAEGCGRDVILPTNGFYK